MKTIDHTIKTARNKVMYGKHVFRINPRDGVLPCSLPVELWPKCGHGCECYLKNKCNSHKNYIEEK